MPCMYACSHAAARVCLLAPRGCMCLCVCLARARSSLNIVLSQVDRLVRSRLRQHALMCESMHTRQ